MQVKDSVRSRRDFGILAAICLILQIAVAPNIAFGNGRANLALVFAGIASLMLGGRTGVLCGFAAGLIFDLSTTGPIGLMALMLSIASYILGMEVHDRISEEPVMTLIPFSIAALSVSLVYGLLALAFGMGESLFDAIFLRALPSALLTIIAYLPFLYFLGRSHRGQIKSGTPGRQSRYTLGTR